MQDLSKMLSHKTVRVTEKYYAPWVPERQAPKAKISRTAANPNHLFAAGPEPSSRPAVAEIIARRRLPAGAF